MQCSSETKKVNNSIQGLLDDYGCLHFKFPILLGISPPSYSTAQLKQFKNEDNKKIKFEGKEYTKYEAKQMQRKIETAARHAKDRQIIAKAAGDDTLRRAEQAKINILTNKYNDFNKAAGLSSYKERMSVSGYHKVKTNSDLTKHDISKIIITDKQFGEKLKRHARDFGLDASKAEDREKFRSIILDIIENASEVACGGWRGQNHEKIFYYISGNDVVLTKVNGEFISILKGGVSNARVKNARRQKI